MERLKLVKSLKNKKLYTRETAKMTLENVIKRIKEANRNDEFIYKITKAVLFGSYINSNKEKVGDLDIAIYIELKDKSKPELEQNMERASTSNSYVPVSYTHLDVYKRQINIGSVSGIEIIHFLYAFFSSVYYLFNHRTSYKIDYAKNELN